MKFILTVVLFMLSAAAFSQSYLAGDRVDVYTTDAKYYAATIVEISSNQLKVRYLGFSADRDAWVKEENVVRGGAKGDKIIVVASSGTFQGKIEAVLLNEYKVKYDGYAETYTLVRSQFNFISSPAESRKNYAQNGAGSSTTTPSNNNTQPVKTAQPATTATNNTTATTNGTYPVGTKLLGLEGKTWYAATVLEYNNGKYRVKWDDYTTEAWLTPNQIKLKPTLPAGKTGAANGKVYVRSMYWIATGNTELSWFFLGDNGVIIINPMFGTNPANPALEQTDNYKNVGLYTMGANSLDVKWLNGTATSYPLKTKNGEIIELDAGGIMARQRGLPENYKLNGTYKGSISFGQVSSSATYTFRNDGTMTVTYTGTAAQGRAENVKQGKYYIKGSNLLMTFTDGTKTQANVGTADGTGNSNIVINSTWLTKT